MDKKKLSMKEIGAARLVILFLAGILLIFLSVSDFGTEKGNVEIQTVEPEVRAAANQKTEDEPVDEIEMYENKLKSLLEKVSGVGNVEVMITKKSSKEVVVLKDSPYSQEIVNETDSEGGSRTLDSKESKESTVLVKGTDGESVPFVTKELSAEIEGVLVIAEGGANGTVATGIVAAVEALFGVPAHKITVLPMEDGN